MEKQQKTNVSLPTFLRSGKSSAPAIKSSGWKGLNLVKKILLILLSLVCAMLLWGYVLLTQNPDRTKEFTGIEVKLESGSEADLLYKNLMVYGGSAGYLRDVTVTVTAPLADITKLSSKDITATVNFNDVHGAGKTTLNIRAVSSAGTVVSIEPSTIEVDIDSISTRTLAVSSELVGELSEGYWRDSLSFSPKSITVKGASRDIETISKAACVINLSELTESIDNSMVLELIDTEGRPFDQTKLIESIPAVDVQMTVYPYKTVDIINNIAGVDELPPGLEVSETRLSIDSLRVACPYNDLQKLLSIAAETVNISNINKPGSYDYTLALNNIPKDAVLIDYPNLRSVKLTVVVSEAVEEKLFKNISVQVYGKQPEYKYEYLFADELEGIVSPKLAANITVIGAAEIIDQIGNSSIKLFIDLTGLGVGEYDIPLCIVWNDLLHSLKAIEYPATIHVTITAAQP